TEDTHHLLHTMRFGPEGFLYFLQSIYIHSHIETPWGVRRLMGGGVWEFRPETRKLEIISKGLINPWGFEFDRWGQSFAADGAGSEGVNYIFPGSVFATSPGAKRIVHGMSPGQPKQSGQEIVDDPYWPQDWQGTVIQNDFRGGRVNRFTITPNGSAYIAKQEKDVLASTHVAFRPIDVKFGPDGALYIADWYNPIIQHGEVDFRDPRRDHEHGRIWRITPKGRTAPALPEIAGKPVPELLEMLKSPRKYVRHFAKRELRAHGAAEVAPAVDAWAEALDKAAPNYQHDLLEAAWTRECVNQFSPKLWRTLWACSDYRARAAALRILSHRWRELPDAKKVLAAAIADENAQVRLWAVAVLADMRTPAAFETALKALDKPMDESLDFLLELTAREQADVWMPAVAKEALKLTNPKHLVYALKSTGRSDALPPLFAALKGGKLSAEDAAAVLAVAGDSADAAQAKEMADMVNDPAMAAQVVGLMEALMKAGSARKVIPEGAEALVTAWLASPRAEIVHRATFLAGYWKVEKARDTLVGLLTNAATIPQIKDGALRGLTALGGGKTRDLFDKLFRESQDASLKALCIEGLTAVAPPTAAKHAVEFLATANTGAQATTVLGAFLKDKKLPDVLAKELAGNTLPEAVAVEGIRMVTTRGIKGGLADALKTAGKVKQMDHMPTAEEMAALVEKVKASGDPKRGEAVFRRQQLLCMSCHAIGDAGGVLGPNLVSIGASAPIDYLIESILNPTAKIKEGYHMIIVSKKDGQVVSGGLVQDGNEELVIRDPANQMQKVAKSEIASRVISPVSMMPPGLTASLREDEFLDLVSFLSQLGKEGAYKIAPNKYVRTWKTMGVMEQADIDHVRHDGLQNLNDRNYKFPWLLAYSQVNGDLPLADLPAAAKMYPWFPKIAQLGLKLTADGKVKLAINETKGVIVVVDNEEVKDLKAAFDLDLKAGSHLVTVLVTREAGDLQGLRVELVDGAAVME
ncbi:MAG: dehydrogenase, partial [Verrucomicrobiaceae bacterium]|nr:dehydrogenase [Verrucomicrobiaceae bacterium]